MKARSCNFDHLIPNFYIVKLGFRQGNTHFSFLFFLFFLLKKIDYGCTHNLFLSQEKQQQNDHNFHVKMVIYTVVKIRDWLLGCVNVMQSFLLK